MRLDLNLSRRPFTNDTLVWILVGALSITAVGLTAWNVVLFATTGSQVATLSARRASLEAERRAAAAAEHRLLQSISRARTELLASKASFANVIIQEWSFSWTELFNELEQVMPMGVRLTNIRPRVDDGLWIRLDGVARDNQSFWELQENLMKWPVFGNVYPDVVQPSTLKGGMSQGELLISLEMEYFPDAREKLGLEEEVMLAGTEKAAEPVAADSAAQAVQANLHQDAGTGGKQPGEKGKEENQAQPLPASSRNPTPAVTRRAGPKKGHGRRRSRPRARAGIERKTPLPSGQPGMTPPDIHGIVIPSVPGRAILDRPVVVTPDHRIVDEEGREIPIQEIINQPGGIHPRRPGEEIPGEDAEKQDGKKRNGKGPSKGPVPPAGKRP